MSPASYGYGFGQYEYGGNTYDVLKYEYGGTWYDVALAEFEGGNFVYDCPSQLIYLY